MDGQWIGATAFAMPAIPGALTVEAKVSQPVFRSVPELAQAD
jgi:hypothetical protein